MAERICKIHGRELEIQFAPDKMTDNLHCTLAGQIRGDDFSFVDDGGSLLIEIIGTGRVEEAFIDHDGRFEQVLELASDNQQRLELTLYSIAGEEIGSAMMSVGETGETPDSSPAALLQPEWPAFARLVRQCLILAGEVADRTGRDRDELFEQVYAQERYAEKAFETGHQRQYQECADNLRDFLAYLERLTPTEST